MNICFISPGQFNPKVGGIDAVCTNIIPILQDKGYNIVSCYLWKSTEQPLKGLENYQFVNSKDIYSSENIEQLKNIITTHNIDIIWNHSFLHELHNVCVKAKGNCKLVYSMHCEPIASLKEIRDKLDRLYINRVGKNMFYIAGGYIKHILGYFLRKKHLSKRYVSLCKECDIISVLSEFHIKDIKELTNIKDTSKIVAINNPVALLNPHTKAKRKQILFVGRLVWQKRLDRVLKVWSIAQNELHDWELIVVGDGPDRHVYEYIANKLNLVNIRFVGSQPSSTYMEEASVLCMASSHEGFGMVLVEALKNSCIPISFDSFAAVHDIIDNGYNGYIIPSYDIKLYASTIIKICTDIDTRNHISSKGLESVKKFDAYYITQQWIDVFKNITK